jgi:hypothetical protein
MHPWQLQALLGASQPPAFPDSAPVMRQTQQQQYQPQQRQYQRPLSWHPTSLPTLGAQSVPQNAHHLSNNGYHLPGPGMQFPPPLSMSPAPSMTYSPDPFLLPATPPLICSDSAMYSTATSANASPNWQLQIQQQHHQQQMAMVPNTYQLPSPAVSLNQQPCWEQKSAPPPVVAQQQQQQFQQVQSIQQAQQVQQMQQMHPVQPVQHVQPHELLLRTPRHHAPQNPALQPGYQPPSTMAPTGWPQTTARADNTIDLTHADDDEVLADAAEEQDDEGDEDAAEDDDEDAAAEDDDEDADAEEDVDRSDVVLVGLGLYDPPRSTFGESGLRLITESWQPPAESAADEEGEDADEQDA